MNAGRNLPASENYEHQMSPSQLRSLSTSASSATA